MSELLQAAKAIIHLMDYDDYCGTVGECEAVNRLIEAVERAENAIKDTDAYEHGYIAGQKAMKAHERERIKVIIKYQFGELVSDLSEVMEMIDE